MSYIYSQVLSGGIAPPAPAIISGPTGAYATLLLVPGYAGSCLRVRRSSDNTEQDIGFTSTGALDTASLLSFVGANNGFVRTWYDQSGNARDFGQATQANQPQIVSSGNLVIGLNGHVVLDFDGSNDVLDSTAIFTDFVTTSAGTAWSIFAADTISGTLTNNVYANDAVWQENIGQAGLQLRKGFTQAYNWDGNDDHAELALVDGQSIIHVWRHSGGNIEGYVNGNTAATAASGNTVGATHALRFGKGTANQLDGKIAAMVFYGTALSATNIAAMGRNLAAIYGTPWGA